MTIRTTGRRTDAFKGCSLHAGSAALMEAIVQVAAVLVAVDVGVAMASELVPVAIVVAQSRRL